MVIDLVEFLLARIAEDESEAEYGELRDPRRMRRECEAKRLIIDRTFSYEATIDGEWGCCHDPERIRAGECPDIPVDEIDMLRLLALPYQDHPDYQQEWSVLDRVVTG